MLAFDQEQILPALEMGLNLKDSICNQSGERTCNLTRGIEDTQPPSKLIPLVERGKVEDHTGVESRFGHSQEPSRRHDSSEVRGGSTDHCHRAEDHHGDWKNEFRSEFLGEHVHWGAGEDEGDVENREKDVVLVAFEMKVVGHVVGLCIS